MNWALSTVYNYVKMTYDTAVQFIYNVPSSETISNVLTKVKAKYKVVKNVIISYVNKIYYYTKPNKNGDGIVQTQSSYPLRRFDYLRDWEELGSQPVENDLPARVSESDQQDYQQQPEAFERPVGGLAEPIQAGRQDGPRFVQWRPIKMNVEEFNRIRRLTKESFKKLIENFTCPITREIMKEPCSMKCCRKLREKSERYAQKAVLEFEILKRRRCVLCRKRANKSFICFQEKIDTYLNGLRQKVMVTYYNLDEEQKMIWKVLIDQSFGNGYTERHLDNIQFVQ